VSVVYSATSTCSDLSLRAVSLTAEPNAFRHAAFSFGPFSQFVHMLAKSVSLVIRNA